MKPAENIGVSVALVSPQWPQGKIANGIVAYVANLVDGLRQCACRPHVLAWELRNGGPEDEIHLVVSWEGVGGCLARAGTRLGLPWVGDWCRQRAASQAIATAAGSLQRTVGLDLIEMEESFGYAGMVAARASVPVVARLHGPWFAVGSALGLADTAASRRRVAAEGRALELVAGVSAPSRDTLTRVRNHYGIELPDAEVIPNPIVPVPREHRWSRVFRDRDSFLFVGRFDRVKGGDVLIDAFTRVIRSDSGARLLFVGPDRGCIDENGRRWSLPEYLSERVPDAGVRSRIEYVGSRSSHEIATLRQRCCAIIVCSRYENFPMVALEAMSQGCPIIASAVGGIPEMIQHEHNGLLCRPGDPKDLAVKMLTLLRNPELAAGLGRQAAIDAGERYHPAMIAEKMLGFYRRVIERSKLSTPVRRRWWG